MHPRFRWAALAAALVLAPLGRAELPPDPTVEPPNLYEHKLQLKAYVDSGGYAKGVAKVSLDAVKYLQKRVPKGAGNKRMAVVFDLDETTLTNLTQIIANDYGYFPKAWDEWIASGRCPAIIPVQTIYDTAVRLKVDIIFITGRPETVRAATERNLREVGYETWTKIFFKPTTDVTLSMAGFKTDVRRKLTQEGYVIIANIGDQNSDLVGGYAEKIFKLPNPFYLSR